MRQRFILTFVIIFATSINTTWAIDLGDAKSQGLVGETPRGYLQAVAGATDELKGLIKSVNSKRKKQYEKIASQNNTSLESVESMAGKKAINMTKSGNYIKMNGKWTKK